MCPMNWKMCQKNLEKFQICSVLKIMLILKMCLKNFENIPKIFSKYDQSILKFSKMSKFDSAQTFLKMWPKN
jgi:hypothetical protein